jgi:Zn-finger nucleic acid-binding protein
MKCPNCDTTLAMSERLGVEIDYCPQCRGVWLDRGEIDRLLEAERGQTVPAPAVVAAAPASPPQPAYAPPAPHGYEDRGGYDQRHQRKRKWSDLLDFD